MIELTLFLGLTEYDLNSEIKVTVLHSVEGDIELHLKTTFIAKILSSAQHR